MFGLCRTSWRMGKCLLTASLPPKLPRLEKPPPATIHWAAPLLCVEIQLIQQPISIKPMTLVLPGSICAPNLNVTWEKRCLQKKNCNMHLKHYKDILDHKRRIKGNERIIKAKTVQRLNMLSTQSCVFVVASSGWVWLHVKAPSAGTMRESFLQWRWDRGWWWDAPDLDTPAWLLLDWTVMLVTVEFSAFFTGIPKEKLQGFRYRKHLNNNFNVY